MRSSVFHKGSHWNLIFHRKGKSIIYLFFHSEITCSAPKVYFTHGEIFREIRQSRKVRTWWNSRTSTSFVDLFVCHLFYLVFI